MTVMAAVAMAAAGCVSVSQPPSSHSPPRPPGHSRPGDPAPGRAREGLITIGPDGAGGPQSPGQDPGAATAGAAPGPDGAIAPSGRFRLRDDGGPPGTYGFGDPPGPSRDGAEPSRSADSPWLPHPPRRAGRSWASPDRPASPDFSPSLPQSEVPAPPPEQQHTADSPPASESRQEAPPPAQAPPPAPAPAPRARTNLRNNNVCAMGRQHGRWQQGGDASRICDSVYGH
ncbi:hypothetical protein ABZY03_30805 [Streptomyces klenkii]|uniref:hypothetical protein n=1 Tax=Streptomyces klenkii TaxID=1420899 RepID=UPI0033BCAEE2